MSADATSPESNPSDGADGAVSSPGAGQQTGAISMEEAFAAAEATLGTADAGDADSGSPDAGQQADAADSQRATGEPGQQGEGGETPGPGDSKPPSQTTPAADQATLNRIQTLVEQGRIGELTPRERGIYNSIAQRALEDRQIQERVIDRALELRSLETDDPAAYVQWRRENPSQAKAYDQFWDDPAHANLTAENRRPQRSEQQIRAAVQAEWESVVQETARTIATQGGLSGDEYGRLEQEHGSNYGSLLQASFNAAVDKAVNAKLSTERARIEEEATAAARRELEVEYAQRNPLRFPGGGTTGNPNPSTPQKAGSMEEAFAITEEQFARSARS